MGWEERFLLFLQESVRNPILDKVMQFVTSLGDAGFLAILACIVLLCIKKYRRAGAAASLSLSLDFLVVNLVLKNLVARIRPYDVFEELILITRRPSDLSFPSGHAGSLLCSGKRPVPVSPEKVRDSGPGDGGADLLFTSVCGRSLPHGCAWRNPDRLRHRMGCVPDTADKTSGTIDGQSVPKLCTRILDTD